MLNVKKLFTQVLTKLKLLDTNKLNTSGGTVTGDIVVQKSSTASVQVSTDDDTGIQLKQSGDYTGLYSVDDSKWIIRYEHTNNQIDVALDTNAAASTTDGALYSALSSLAWTDAITSGMMGMKKLLTKILESFKKSSASVAINTTYAYASGDTVKLEKCGKVVILSMGALKNLPNSTVNLCTIPAGYRPEKQEDIRTYEPVRTGTSRAVRVIVYTNGVVSCYSYGNYSDASMVNIAVRMVYFTA